MRVSGGILASAAVLLIAGAAGFVGTWALATGAVLALVGGVSLVIAMETKDSYEAGIGAFAEIRSATAPHDFAS